MNDQSESIVDDDEDEYEVVTEQVYIAKDLGTAVTVRFDADAGRRLRNSAKLSGLTQAEFLRQCALLAIDYIERTGTPLSEFPRALHLQTADNDAGVRRA
jgi:hypothetical protein